MLLTYWATRKYVLAIFKKTKPGKKTRALHLGHAAYLCVRLGTSDARRHSSGHSDRDSQRMPLLGVRVSNRVDHSWELVQTGIAQGAGRP